MPQAHKIQRMSFPPHTTRANYASLGPGIVKPVPHHQKVGAQVQIFKVTTGSSTSSTLPAWHMPQAHKMRRMSFFATHHSDKLCKLWARYHEACPTYRKIMYSEMTLWTSGCQLWHPEYKTRISEAELRPAISEMWVSNCGLAMLPR